MKPEAALCLDTAGLLDLQSDPGSESVPVQVSFGLLRSVGPVGPVGPVVLLQGSVLSETRIWTLILSL